LVPLGTMAEADTVQAKLVLSAIKLFLSTHEAVNPNPVMAEFDALTNDEKAYVFGWLLGYTKATNDGLERIKGHIHGA